MSIITDKGRKNWRSRLGWFVLLYVASFVLIVVVAYGLKAAIPH